MKRYYIGRILEPHVFDIKVVFGLPLDIVEKLTDDHPCLICKKDVGADYETVFCIRANNQYEAEAKLIRYTTIPERTLRY